MPRYEKYYVVEFRFPFKVDGVDSIQQAVGRAVRICERMFGFKPSNWYARIFEYSASQKEPGYATEYFYNPNSSTYREITKNIGYHNDLVERGIDPIDIGLITEDDKELVIEYDLEDELE